MIPGTVPMPGGGSKPPITLAFTDSDFNNSDASSYTFTAKAIGTASATRRVVVGVTARWSGSVGTYPSTLTVGGVTCNRVDLQTDGTNWAALYIGNVPTGTTGDVVISGMGNQLNWIAIGVWALDNVLSNTPIQTGGATGSSTSAAGNINVKKDGVTIAIGMHANTGATTWAGVTGNFDTNTNGGTHKAHGGSTTTTADQNPRTITASWASSTGYALITASWR
jgi:hypothetical protein